MVERLVLGFRRLYSGQYMSQLRKYSLFCLHTVQTEGKKLYPCRGMNTSASVLSAFGKLREATISFVMSFCPSVVRKELGSHWKDFNEI